MQTIAAIDVGSKAPRLIVGRTNDFESVEPIENMLLPVRLGGEAFTQGTIGKHTIHTTADVLFWLIDYTETICKRNRQSYF